MTKRRFFAAALLAGLAAGCEMHEQSGPGDSPEESDDVIPNGVIAAPPRETQPGLGQEASPEPSSDSARVPAATANAGDAATQPTPAQAAAAAQATPPQPPATPPAAGQTPPQ